MPPACVGKTGVQGQHLGPTKHRKRQEGQARITGAMDVEDVELPLAKCPIEIPGHQRAKRSLREGAPRAKTASPPDPNHATLGIIWNTRRRRAWTPSQNANPHALALQEVPHVADVLLNAPESGEIALGYYANAKWAHNTVRLSLACRHLGGQAGSGRRPVH